MSRLALNASPSHGLSCRSMTSPAEISRLASQARSPTPEFNHAEDEIITPPGGRTTTVQEGTTPEHPTGSIVKKKMKVKPWERPLLPENHESGRLAISSRRHWYVMHLPPPVRHIFLLHQGQLNISPSSGDHRRRRRICMQDLNFLDQRGDLKIRK
jgi:hypothetical protein